MRRASLMPQVIGIGASPGIASTDACLTDASSHLNSRQRAIGHERLSASRAGFVNALLTDLDV